MKKLQGRTLIEKLKRKPMTYRQMLEASPSNSPWKRVKECLTPDEQLIYGQDSQGWTTWRVTKATKWPA